MFGRLRPEATSNVKDTKAWDFSLGMMWQQWYQRGETQQTLGTAYSTRLDHVEMIMTQSSWDNEPVDSKPGFVRRKILHHPSFGPGRCARLVRPIMRLTGGYAQHDGGWASIPT